MRHFFTVSVFTFLLLFIFPEQPAKSEQHQIAVITAKIDKANLRHIKLNKLVIERAKYFNPRKDAAIIGWLRQLSDTEEELSGLYLELAEELEK